MRQMIGIDIFWQRTFQLIYTPAKILVSGAKDLRPVEEICAQVIAGQKGWIAIGAAAPHVDFVSEFMNDDVMQHWLITGLRCRNVWP